MKCNRYKVVMLSLFAAGGVFAALGFLLPIGMEQAYSYVFRFSYGGIFRVMACFGVAFMLYALVYFLFEKTVRAWGRVKCGIFSVGLAFLGSAAFYCLFEVVSILLAGNPSLHPLVFPLALVGGAICLFGFCVLIFFYYLERFRHFSLKGIALDFLLVLLFFLPLFFLWSFCHSVLSDLVKIIGI